MGSGFPFTPTPGTRVRSSGRTPPGRPGRPGRPGPAAAAGHPPAPGRRAGPPPEMGPGRSVRKNARAPGERKPSV